MKTCEWEGGGGERGQGGEGEVKQGGEVRGRYRKERSEVKDERGRRRGEL